LGVTFIATNLRSIQQPYNICANSSPFASRCDLHDIVRHHVSTVFAVVLKRKGHPGNEVPFLLSRPSGQPTLLGMFRVVFETEAQNPSAS
jgi:hypothetical protein